MTISPNLSAIMCDGMGWFSEIDYKRMLLTYDEIYYLLPKDSVPFTDVEGKKQHIFFPVIFRGNPSFKIHHFIPDDKSRQLIIAAAQADISNPKFIQVIGTIPKHEQLYTWRIVNADGDIGTGQSINLNPDEAGLAHALLLNKFLIAANSLQSIPITGKPYIHGLISEKYSAGVERLRAEHPDLLPPPLRAGTIKHNPVVSRIVTALVPDQELEQHTDIDIMQFKEKNRPLFQRYSYAARDLVKQVSALPISDEFEAEVDELIRTEVWKEKAEIEKELKSAWESLFKSAIKSAVGGLVGVGITPFLSLGAIAWASVAAAAIAVSPWVTSELIDFLEAGKKAREHGLYYLLKFARQSESF
ncbi:MAG: hypothetical protein HY695_23620 [Deltaproteobacteria bacterium]|nr:hypothetical protein [Deltaproteobacteria bacterium]